MNFTTDLPKKDPIVSYIVASAVKCEKFFPGSSKEGPVFRMHAVILTKKQSSSLSLNDAFGSKSGHSNSNGGFGVSRQNAKHTGTSKWAPAQNATKYILCHVRKVTNKKENIESEEEDEGELNRIGIQDMRNSLTDTQDDNNISRRKIQDSKTSSSS